MLVSNCFFTCITTQAAATKRERINRKSKRERQMATVMMSVRMREQIVQALTLWYTHSHPCRQAALTVALNLNVCLLCHPDSAVIAIFCGLKI